VHDFLKRTTSYAHIPILIITAQPFAPRDIGALNDPDRILLVDPTRAAKVEARRAMRTGSLPPPMPTSVLPKPPDMEALLRVVAAAAAKKKRGSNV